MNKTVIVYGMSEHPFVMNVYDDKDIAEMIMGLIEYAEGDDIEVGHIDDLVVRVAFIHGSIHKKVAVVVPMGIHMPNISLLIRG